MVAVTSTHTIFPTSPNHNPCHQVTRNIRWSPTCNLMGTFVKYAPRDRTEPTLPSGLRRLQPKLLDGPSARYDAVDSFSLTAPATRPIRGLPVKLTSLKRKRDSEERPLEVSRKKKKKRKEYVDTHRNVRKVARCKRCWSCRRSSLTTDSTKSGSFFIQERRQDSVKRREGKHKAYYVGLDSLLNRSAPLAHKTPITVTLIYLFAEPQILLRYRMHEANSLKKGRNP